MKEIDALEIELKVFARWYPRNWLAIPLAMGVQFKNIPETKPFERCVARPGSSRDVTGKSCEVDALFLEREGEFKVAGVVEAALVVVPFPSMWRKLAPCLEIRNRLEGIGQEELNRVSLGIFVSPTNTPILSRFEVSAEYLHNFDTHSSDLRPVLFVGGSI
ncbi:MAG: hypothetical protein JXR76_06220 [Deltaproteobacteria bacterium]|nr:hypothetical protein [Deltaproteobacteria bacterium]